MPQPISPYGITKLACEQLAHAYATGFGLDAVSLRYFTVYGPRQRPDMFFRRVCDLLGTGGTFEIYGTGEQSRSFTEVGDVVAATMAAMDGAPAGALYNVGGGDEASMLEAIALLERHLGPDARRPARRSRPRRRQPHEGGHLAHPRGAGLGAARRPRGRPGANVGLGLR